MCILILIDIIQDWGLYPKPKSCQGIGWVMLNSVVAVCDRLLQRLLLSKDVFGFRVLAQAQQSVPQSAQYLVHAEKEIRYGSRTLQSSLFRYHCLGISLCQWNP